MIKLQLPRFVSRINPRDPSQHSVLGTQQYRPQEFATNINLNLDNAWGVLYYIIRVCMDLEDGKYLIMKDPNKVDSHLHDMRRGVAAFCATGGAGGARKCSSTD